MFYPTGESTEGRTVISIFDHEESLMRMEESETTFLESLTEWLDEKEYCVEKKELRYFMENSESCTEEEITEMEGGGDAGGGAFASLGSTPGMGDVAAPLPDGTPGSGDVFGTLTVGTPAAKKSKKSESKSKPKKKRRKLRTINDFESFVKAMKANQ